MCNLLRCVYGASNGVELKIQDANKMFGERLPDYHVFAIPSNKYQYGDSEIIEMKVYNGDNLPPIDIDRLRKEIIETISPN